MQLISVFERSVLLHWFSSFQGLHTCRHFYITMIVSELSCIIPFLTFFLFLRMFWLEIKTQGLAIFCGENVCLYSSVNSLCSRRIWFPHFWGLLWARRLKFWVKFVELCACGSARISFQFINKPSCTLQSPYTHFLDINMGGAFYSVSTVHPSIAEWKNCCREIARGILIAIEIWGEGQLQSRTSLESIFVLFVWRG